MVEIIASYFKLGNCKYSVPDGSIKLDHDSALMALADVYFFNRSGRRAADYIDKEDLHRVNNSLQRRLQKEPQQLQ
jgi:hypothetical protein